MDDGYLSDCLNEVNKWITKGLWHRKLLKHGRWVIWIPTDGASDGERACKLLKPLAYPK